MANPPKRFAPVLTRAATLYRKPRKAGYPFFVLRSYRNTVNHPFTQFPVLPMIDAWSTDVSALRRHPGAIGTFDEVSSRE
jgi:hypothetical protein